MSVATETITNTESAPSAATDGVDCAAWSHVALAVDIDGLTNVDIVIWLLIGGLWVKGTMLVGTTLTALDFDGVGFDFGIVVGVNGATRIFCQVDAFSGGAGGETITKKYARFNTWSV